jgi:hypothetical protein
MRLLLTIAALSIAAGPLAAQSSVVTPKRLAPEQEAVRSEYLRFRDTLHVVEAATARLVRDMGRTSDAAMSSRAKTVQTGCVASLAMYDSARVRITALEGNANVQRRRTKLLESFGALQQGLQDCEKDFGRLALPENLVELRGYSMSRGNRLRAVIQHFNAASRDYLRTVGIEVRPIGAGPNPLAG